MKLLVTGGAGYIGAVVAARLIDEHHEVVVLDDLSTGYADNVPDGAEFVEGRIQEAEPLLRSGGFDAILHFAAKSLVGESVTAPELYWGNNVVGTFQLLRAARSARVQRFVFSSTAATYGEPDTSPIDEGVPGQPVNPYGHSKLAVDFMLQDECEAHGLGAVSLRYFNVGGAYRRHGERHDPETHLIPNLLAVPAGKRASAAVFGTDYPTRDGTAVRDYLHVVDLADAHLLALDAAKPGSHRIFNLGTGTGYTVREVVDACRRVTGHELPVREEPRRAGDPVTLVASADLAAAEMGWRTRFGLDDIVRDAWAFERDGTTG
jgi:UDP-glucose 4-epimerase